MVISSCIFIFVLQAAAMKLIKKFGIFIYWCILILDCFLCIVNSQGQMLDYRVFTKPLLIPVIAFYFYTNTKRSKHPRSKTFIYSALFLSWIADLLLLNSDLIYYSNAKHQSDAYLFIGTLLLLLAIGLYGAMYNKMNKLILKDCQEAFLTALGMVVVTLVFYKFLKTTELGNFKYLIIAGMATLTIVMALAANVYKDKIRKNMAYKFFIPGTITLVLSLGILIGFRFLLQEAEFLPAVIVLTYGFGQMLVMRGFTKYLKA